MTPPEFKVGDHVLVPDPDYDQEHLLAVVERLGFPEEEVWSAEDGRSVPVVHLRYAEGVREGQLVSIVAARLLPNP